jgi:type I restriction enzyme R subunit
LDIAPTVDSVNDLQSEIEELVFVRSFRELMRVKNTLSTFSDFSFEDLEMTEQEFEDYKSKYLDIYDKARNDNANEKDSILDDVDFELELIHKDEVNVAYILQLLSHLVGADEEMIAQKKKQISDILSGDAHLRSKKELIEQFIEENLVSIGENDSFEEVFENYWSEEKKKAFVSICKDEGIEEGKLQKIIEDYLFSEQEIMKDDVMEALTVKPKVLERKKKSIRIIDKIMGFVETFINGMAA